MTHARRARSQSGIVLVMVLFFVLLLASTMASFLRRVAIDAGVAMNRDRAQEAESLARGGVRLGEAILLEDLRTRSQQGGPDSRHDLWARAGDVDLIDDPDVSLNVRIEDAASRINLNGFLQKGVVSPEDRIFLQQFFAGVIAVMPGRPEDHLHYEPLQLAANFADWIDQDDVSADGAPEDQVYARRDPPTRVPNRPLLSVDELRLIDGFDGRLVDALRPYVGVYPLVGGGGVNLNTAQPWVLIQMTGGSAVSGLQPFQEKDVRRIVDARDEGPLCGGTTQDASCTPLSGVLDYDKIEPMSTERSTVFVVTAVARVVDVERTIEATIDRAAEGGPKRLSWRVF